MRKRRILIHSTKDCENCQRGIYSNLPTRGQHWIGVESDIYDCFVVLAELTGAHERLVTYGFREKPRGLLFQETIFTCMAVLQW